MQKKSAPAKPSTHAHGVVFTLFPTEMKNEYTNVGRLFGKIGLALCCKVIRQNCGYHLLSFSDKDKIKIMVLYKIGQ